MKKTNIRNKLKLFRQSMSKELVALNSKDVAKILFDFDIYKNSKYIYLYSAIQNEILTDDIAKKAIADGKIIAYPKVSGNKMDFYRIYDLSELIDGYMGIKEPPADNPVISAPGIMLIPGIAFDLKLNRVGFGAGFYDRYLNEHTNTLIALAHDFQIVESIATESHDIKMHYIITEKRILGI
ncbi:MAG: 5-formyltetrahydrofolate cyclo-ligase [Eubacterium sp.]